MTTVSTRSGFNPEQLLMLAAHMASDLPGDRQVLDDGLLQQVLRGERKLTRTQRDALLASPTTLNRLRFLESQRLAAQAAEADEADEGQGAWQRTEARLLAAAGDGPYCTLLSPDGQWRLQALTTGSTTRLKLRLLKPNSQGDELERQGLRLEPEMEVAVLDGSRATLLMGWLDDDGDLEAVWDRPQDLRSHLAQHGGTWTVVRV